MNGTAKWGRDEINKGVALLTAFTLSVPVFAQYTQSEHDRAVAAQNAHDARHHNTAKTVGGSAAGGAVVGGLLGGGKGAAIGAGVGAGGGVLADKARKRSGVRKREARQTGEYR